MATFNNNKKLSKDDIIRSLDFFLKDSKKFWGLINGQPKARHFFIVYRNKECDAVAIVRHAYYREFKKELSYNSESEVVDFLTDYGFEVKNKNEDKDHYTSLKKFDILNSLKAYREDRDAFWAVVEKKSAAKSLFIRHKNKNYPAKAIVRYACIKQNKNSIFYSNRGPFKEFLEERGFTVVYEDKYAKKLEKEGAFDPSSIEDAREKTLRAIAIDLLPAFSPFESRVLGWL